MRVPLLLAAAAISLTLSCETALAKPAKAKAAKSPDYYDIKDTENVAIINDPWESFNQPIFKFNVAFDRYLFKPFISAYDVIPKEVRSGIGNILSNLTEPLNVIHGVLQLKPNVAFTSFWRFVLNSSFGLGGWRDFARDDAGLKYMGQNLGKTLGYYGVPAGPYVVLPILGPSSVRDTTGRVGDWFADPVTWVEQDVTDSGWTSVAHAAIRGIDARDKNSGVIEHLYYESLDPYAATRSAYRQHEKFAEHSKE